MGAGASSRASKKHIGEIKSLREESTKPSDASDVTTLDEAKQLITSLRQTATNFLAKIDEDDKARHELLNKPNKNFSFRGVSLATSIKKSSKFVTELLDIGYQEFEEKALIEGFQTLKSTLASPTLSVMLARHTATETLQKKLDSHDEDVNDFIIGHYANSDSIHDVSLVRQRAKTKFSSALKKLKVNIMVSSMMGAMTPKTRQRTSSFFAGSNNHLKVLHTSAEKDELEQVLSGMGEWSFDVWDLVKLSNNQPMLICGMELFKRWGLDSGLKISDLAISNFFRELEKGYNVDNPYHNNVHGADVMYSVHCFMENSKRMHDELSQKDVLAALVAAAAHDYKHDGVNNAFHINTHSELATLYNDRSVLENMHAAELFRLMKVKKFNIFSILSPEEFTEARKIATSAILGTDMTKHFNHIADFQSRLAAEAEFTRNPDHGPIPENQKVDKFHMIEMALHCADISNPAKPIACYQKWVVVVMNEFFAQGDKERDLGMNISPMFDRDNTMVSKTQGGFIDFIIKPIYAVWGEFIPELKEAFDSGIAEGRAFDWDTYYEENKNNKLFEKAKEMVVTSEGENENDDDDETKLEEVASADLDCLRGQMENLKRKEENQ